MKVIIAGSRDFNDYQLLCKTMSELDIKIDAIVCGGARGADSLGRIWANENNIPVVDFPANWNRYGKSAGFIRNKEMGDYADYLVAFWDKKSKGTKDMKYYMQQLGKHGKVILFENK